MSEYIFQPTHVSDLVTTPARAAVEIERLGKPGAALAWWHDNANTIAAALKREQPRGACAEVAVLFGRMPEGVARPSWCVESLSYQWSDWRGNGTWELIYTPTGLAQDRLPGDTDGDKDGEAYTWLRQCPDGQAWIAQRTQKGLCPDATGKWLTLPTKLGDSWPVPIAWKGGAYQVPTIGDDAPFGALPVAVAADAGVVIDDETKLHAGAVEPSTLTLTARYELFHAAGLTEQQCADATAGKYKTGAYRGDLGQQRYTDATHRLVARALGWLMASPHGAEVRTCASNHGAYLPCVFPCGHGALYTQSPWGWGAPLESELGLSSVKLYGGTLGKPGLWQPAGRTHYVFSGAMVQPGTTDYANGMSWLAACRAESALMASRRPLGIWLQCSSEESPWMLATEQSRRLFRLAWLLTAGGGTLFLTIDGSQSSEYAQQWFDELGRAHDEMLSRVSGSDNRVVVQEDSGRRLFMAGDAVVEL